MNEVTLSSDSVSSVTELQTEEPANWEKVGKVGFYLFSAIAIGSFIPAQCKKKKFHVVKLDGPIITSPSIELQSVSVETDLSQPKVSSPPNFKDLSCTKEQKTHIHEIISTLGTQGKMSLLWQQSHLRELGDKIKDVHPLKFIAIIITDPYLKNCIGAVWQDYFKRNGFLEDLIPSINREMEKGKFQIYIPNFAQEVGVNPDHLQKFIVTKDWENFIALLTQK